MHAKGIFRVETMYQARHVVYALFSLLGSLTLGVIREASHSRHQESIQPGRTKQYICECKQSSKQMKTWRRRKVSDVSASMMTLCPGTTVPVWTVRLCSPSTCVMLFVDWARTSQGGWLTDFDTLLELAIATGGCRQDGVQYEPHSDSSQHKL